MDNTIMRVGAYTRLSKEDGSPDESASIDTQKQIIQDFAKKQGWNITKIYVDDGYSGTNFNRPDFQRMKKDIENGEINCVITKDLSRLGRNYIDCGFYMEMYFPKYNVRYIAINDGVDTLNNMGMDITPFKNILNEMYAQDISKKIKSAVRIKFENGNYKGTYAPYGYRKDEKNKNHLIVDENLRGTIRKIFDLALEGNGVRKIMIYLTDKKVLKPSAYHYLNGDAGFENSIQTGMYNWTENSVRNILRSPIYCGDLVGYKRPTISFKNKRKISKKPEEWEVVPNTHEGIVTREEFDLVQKMMNNRRGKQCEKGFVNVFAGVIKCADCGKRMRATTANRRKRPNPIDCVQYTCGSYASYGTESCSSHCIEARTIFNIVLDDINKYANMAIKDNKSLKELQNNLKMTSEKEYSNIQKELKKINKRLLELDNIISSLYEDKVLNRISERNFNKMSEKYLIEQKQLDERHKSLEKELKEQEEKDKGAVDFLNLVKDFNGIEELTTKIINTLIDRIYVSEKITNIDGTITQKIKICYKFIGNISEITYNAEKYKPYLTERKVVCSECEEEFTTTSGVAKYCDKCRVIVHRRQCCEGKKKSRERAKNKN